MILCCKIKGAFEKYFLERILFMPIVDLALYGKIARALGGKHVAQQDVALPDGATVGDLFTFLKISPDEKSFVFINAVLCDLPGLNASWNEPLHDGDHVGVFALGYMWPYQYRNGAPMSESLKDAMREYGVMYNVYGNV